VARLGSVRWRAPDTVTSLIFTPDGRYLIGQLRGPSFVIWSYPDGKQVGSFELPLVRSIDADEPDEPLQFNSERWRFDPDGRSALVHYGWDRVYRVRLPDGKLERVHEGERLEACGMSVDGRRLLVSTAFESDDGAGAHLWLVGKNGSGLTKIDTLPLHFANLKGLCAGAACSVPATPSLSADGRFAVAGFVTDEPNRTPLHGFTAYDLTTGQSWSVRLDGHPDLQFTPDGRGLVAADCRAVTMWRFVTVSGGRTRFEKFATHRFNGSFESDREYQRLALSRSRIVVRTCGNDVTVLNANTMRRERIISPPEGYSWSYGLAVSPDGRTLAVSASSPPRIAFFDLESGRQLRSKAGHTLAVKTLECDPTGRRLLSHSDDGTLRIWDLCPAENGMPIGRHVACRRVGKDAGGFLISRGGRVVYFRKEDGDILSWEVNACSPTLFLRDRELVGQPWLSSDGREILFDNGDNHLVRQPLTGRLRELPSFPVRGGIWRVDYEVPGPGVTIHQGNDRARFDRYSGESLSLTATPPPVAQRYFVNCYRVGSRIEVRDGVTLQSKYFDEHRLASESNEDLPETHGNVSADARLIAYAAGGQAIVRDLDTGEEIARFGRPDSATTVATLAPSGNFLIAGYADGQILVWDLRVRPAATMDAERLWDELGADAATSRRAAARFLAEPTLALDVLARRTQPLCSPTEDEICQLVGELDHPRFPVRERATRLLAMHYESAKGILEMVNAEQLSPEMRERLCRVRELAKGPIINGETLRLVRGIAVLEQIPGKAGTELLQRIASGDGLPAVRASDALVRRALDRR
jgi:WD40 repeat protein